MIVGAGAQTSCCSHTFAQSATNRRPDRTRPILQNVPGLIKLTNYPAVHRFPTRYLIRMFITNKPNNKNTNKQITSNHRSTIKMGRKTLFNENSTFTQTKAFGPTARNSSYVIPGVYDLSVEDSNWVLTSSFIIFTMQTGECRMYGCAARNAP